MKLALGISYLGTEYHGWQNQSHCSSVQQMVEYALSRMANHAVSVQCAGRTDAGVHASKQIVHFETNTVRENFEWVNGGNFYLPQDIRILYAIPVDKEFNARFSAIGRVYHYLIYQNLIPSVFWKNKVMHCPLSLNISNMLMAAEDLIGEHDFSAFRASSCQSKTPIRRIDEINIQKRGDFVVMTFKANAFLHHMVRNIVGSLLEIGLGKKEPLWLKEVLFSKDRRCAGPMASACGLYLADIIYPHPYLFPSAAFPLNID